MELGVLEGRKKITELENENYQLKLKINVLEKRAGGAGSGSTDSLNARVQDAERALERERAANKTLRQDMASLESEFEAKFERDAKRLHAHYQRQVDEYIRQHPRPQVEREAAALNVQLRRAQESLVELEQANHRLQAELQHQLSQVDDTLEPRLAAAQQARNDAENRVYTLELQVDEHKRAEVAAQNKMAALRKQLATQQHQLELSREAEAAARSELAQLKSDAWATPQLKVAEKEAEAQAAVTRAVVAETRVQSLEGELRARQVSQELLEIELKQARTRAGATGYVNGATGYARLPQHAQMAAQIREQKTRIVQLENDKHEILSEHERDRLALEALEQRNAELERTVQQLPPSDTRELQRRLDAATAQIRLNSEEHTRAMAELRQQATEAHYAEMERAEARHRAKRLGLE